MTNNQDLLMKLLDSEKTFTLEEITDVLETNNISPYDWYEVAIERIIDTLGKMSIKDVLEVLSNDSTKSPTS